MKTKLIYAAAGLVVGFLICLLMLNRYEYQATGPAGLIIVRHDKLTGTARSYNAIRSEWMRKLD